jgi:pSer/pThr/pTyr-binding forkhead associated (FHA) protein
MKLSLVVLTPGKGEGKVIPITLPQFLIGRDPQCHLRPASAMISKRHCALLVKGEQAFVRDFDSTNGTFINDEPIKGEVELHHDDKLKVGPLLFSILIEAAVPAKQATPAPATRAPAAAAKTPPPATKAPAKAAEAPAEKPAEKAPEKPAAANAEDDLAAILLLEDDGSSPGDGGDNSVPEGSTVFDVPAISGTTPDGQPVGKEGKDKVKDVKKNQENTSDAARAILEKYMRRPRGS